MLDLFGLPAAKQADVQRFYANSKVDAETWQTWLKPRGKTMAQILLVGPGGNGGVGVIGANSVAAGGGGGSSGGQSSLLIPIEFLPDVLYVSCGHPVASGAGANSQISVAPNAIANHLLLRAAAGCKGNNASAGTAGSGGAAPPAASISQTPLAGLGIFNFLGGQAGISGGAAVSAAALTLPTTGLIVTGGTGGGGLPAAEATGTNGGSFTVPAEPTIFKSQPGGIGSAVATAPAMPGNNGVMGFAGLLFNYGGTGAASTHGTATGGGLVQGRGGSGAPGCGGGGMGGALTGSAAAVVSSGGGGFCIIICW